jgi:hypothetical protein
LVVRKINWGSSTHPSRRTRRPAVRRERVGETCLVRAPGCLAGVRVAGGRKRAGVGPNSERPVSCPVAWRPGRSLVHAPHSLEGNKPRKGRLEPTCENVYYGQCGKDNFKFPTATANHKFPTC